MTRFEILYLLITVVFGFLATDMVLCWAALLRKRYLVKFYWVHVAWSVLILIIAMQFWWGIWRLHTLDDWSFFSAMAIFLELVLLVLAAAVITPSRYNTEPIDLQDFFYENSPVFFTICAVLMIVLATVNLFIGDRALLSMENAIRAIAISVAMLGAMTRSEKVHSVLIISGATLLFVFVLIQVVR
jgi:hypothetical protein